MRLAEHGRNIVRLTTQTKEEFETDETNDTRPFHFSTGVTTLIYQLGNRLRQLRKIYPKAVIRVSVNPTEETLQGIHNRQFDLGQITLPVPEEGLKIMPLFEEELLVLRHINTPMRARHVTTIKPAELADVPFCSIQSAAICARSSIAASGRRD